MAILGGGVENRLASAAALYHAGLAKKVLILQPEEIRIERPALVIDEGAQTRMILESAGVPASDIVFVGRSVASTFDEAQALADWAARNHARLLLVPTDPFHTRRARWILNRQLTPIGARARMIVVPPKRYSTDAWWTSEEGKRHFSSEILKFGWYLIRY